MEIVKLNCNRTEYLLHNQSIEKAKIRYTYHDKQDPFHGDGQKPPSQLLHAPTPTCTIHNQCPKEYIAKHKNWAKNIQIFSNYNAHVSGSLIMLSNMMLRRSGRWVSSNAWWVSSTINEGKCSWTWNGWIGIVKFVAERRGNLPRSAKLRRKHYLRLNWSSRVKRSLVQSHDAPNRRSWFVMAPPYLEAINVFNSQKS